MAIEKNHYQIYSCLLDQMKMFLSGFNPSFRPTEEQSYIKYIQAWWNALINNCSYWIEKAAVELKHTIFFAKFNYEVQAETYKIGMEILKQLRACTFKQHTAKRMQKKLIKELECRLRFIKCY